MKGRILLRFERSPLSEHAHLDVLVMRVLKVMEPIEGEDSFFHRPTEGSLLQTDHSLRFFHLEPHLYNSDRTIPPQFTTDLRLLLAHS